MFSEKKHGITGPSSTSKPTKVDIYKSEMLSKFLINSNFFESDEEMASRERVLGKLNFLAEKCLNGKIHTFGSYRLGVHQRNADIDALLVAPCDFTHIDFFSKFYEILSLYAEEKKELPIFNEMDDLQDLNTENINTKSTINGEENNELQNTNTINSNRTVSINNNVKSISNGEEKKEMQKTNIINPNNTECIKSNTNSILNGEETKKQSLLDKDDNFKVILNETPFENNDIYLMLKAEENKQRPLSLNQENSNETVLRKNAESIYDKIGATFNLEEKKYSQYLCDKNDPTGLENEFVEKDNSNKQGVILYESLCVSKAMVDTFIKDSDTLAKPYQDFNEQPSNILEINKFENKNIMENTLNTQNNITNTFIFSKTIINDEIYNNSNIQQKGLNEAKLITNYKTQDEEEEVGGFKKYDLRINLSKLQKIEDAYVPLIKLEINNIPIDLLFSKVPSNNVASIDLLNDSLLKGMDDKSILSLNGCRVTDMLITLVPSKEVFRDVLRLIKYWAKRRGVYGNSYGFFGGVAYAISVARICQMYPNKDPFFILYKFFEIYSQWKWPEPVLLKKVVDRRFNLKVWDPKTHIADKYHKMPVITPAYPSMCSTHNISLTTNEAMTNEFKRALDVLKESIQYDSLFNEETFKEKENMHPIREKNINENFKAKEGLIQTSKSTNELKKFKLTELTNLYVNKSAIPVNSDANIIDKTKLDKNINEETGSFAVFSNVIQKNGKNSDNKFEEEGSSKRFKLGNNVDDKTNALCDNKQNISDGDNSNGLLSSDLDSKENKKTEAIEAILDKNKEFDDKLVNTVFKKLFATSDFFLRYKYYIIIKITTDESWKGFIESKIRILCARIEENSLTLKALPYPQSFDIDDQIYYFIGLDYKEKMKINIENPVSEFIKMTEKWEQRITQTIEIIINKKKEVGSILKSYYQKKKRTNI